MLANEKWNRKRASYFLFRVRSIDDFIRFDLDASSRKDNCDLRG